MTYVECDKHNVCVTCSKHRSEFKEAVWGMRNGWQCEACYQAEKAARRKAALEAFDEKNFKPWRFKYQDSVKCPYCGTKHEFDYDGDNEVNLECDTCDHTFKLTIDYTPSYSTERIEPKSQEDL